VEHRKQNKANYVLLDSSTNVNDTEAETDPAKFENTSLPAAEGGGGEEQANTLLPAGEWGREQSITSTTSTTADTSIRTQVPAENPSTTYPDWPEWCTEDASFPPEFSGKKLTLLAKYVASPREIVEYDGKTFGLRSWNSELEAMSARYPNLKRVDNRVAYTKHENTAFRGKQTGDKNIRAMCWDKLQDANRDLFRRVDDETGQSNELGDGNFKDFFASRFRLDMWGNVVSIEATSDGALTFFDVDHLFPWSRGGRSKMDNFGAVQFAANRWAKSDKLIPSLTCRHGEADRTNNCLRGISQTQFYNLFDYAISRVRQDLDARNNKGIKGKDKQALAKRGRKVLRREIEDVADWLTISPFNKTEEEKEQDEEERKREREGIAVDKDDDADHDDEGVQKPTAGMITDFQVAVGHIEDGEKLYAFFEEREQEMHRREQQLLGMSSSPSSDDAAAALAPVSTPSKQQQQQQQLESKPQPPIQTDKEEEGRQQQQQLVPVNSPPPSAGPSSVAATATGSVPTTEPAAAAAASVDTTDLPGNAPPRSLKVFVRYQVENKASGGTQQQHHTQHTQRVNIVENSYALNKAIKLKWRDWVFVPADAAKKQHAYWTHTPHHDDEEEVEEDEKKKEKEKKEDENKNKNKKNEKRSSPLASMARFFGLARKDAVVVDMTHDSSDATTTATAAVVDTTPACIRELREELEALGEHSFVLEPVAV
jgi:hypothetical protein